MRENWLFIYVGWNLGSTVETSRLNGQKPFKNVVWIDWMKSRYFISSRIISGAVTEECLEEQVEVHI